ncbi:MAG: amidase family protein [Acidobacteria bacterium]|nr:amidase family protein [Acidobacteriota bacterium]
MRACLLLSLLLLLPAGDWVAGAQAPPPPRAQAFDVTEATIARTHDAMRGGRLTCRTLVESYLARIDAHDKRGAALNAIVQVNADALRTADDLDGRFRASGLTGPLHCIPMIVKDNFETIGLQSAAGSLALQGFVSDTDAFLVARVKAAGAIVLAKSNMAEWAFSPYETVSSILPGYTRNPYALDRVTAGSSGGTAAAVAASFGAVGLGSDTGNSIRGPSAHQALAGIRSTMGLTSRAGVVPLNLLADIAGPLARTLADAVTVFQVIVGEDPDDPVTAASRGRAVPAYADALKADGLKGARVGVLRQAYERGGVDPDVTAVFTAALDALTRAGATIVDRAAIDLSGVRRAQGAGACGGFKYDIAQWFARHAGKTPVGSLAEVIKSRRFHPSVQVRLQSAEGGALGGAPDSAACLAEAEYRKAYGAAITARMDELKLDAYVYPTWSFPPRLIGDLNTPHGDNSQVFSPTSGFPAISVPMGYTRDNRLPAGITFFGRAWDEATLVRLAYAYEQATQHRRAPVLR